MASYTLGLFANMYPAHEGDYRGIFIRQMVRDLESRGVTVKKAVKISPSVAGYIPFFGKSLVLARDTEPDLFQAEYIPHSSLIPALFGRKHTPLVLKFHGDDARIFPFRNRVNLALTRSMMHRAGHILTASEEIRRTLIGIGGDPSRITSIHTGIDTEFFSPGSRDEARQILDLPPDATIFLFVGRLHPWKGIGEILRVAKECPGYRFVFAGPGKVPDHPENCQFTGVLPQDIIRTWLRAADCLLLPTYTEAVPTSVMEAFGCGIPAITSDVGGCPEIVDPDRNGLMVPVRDADALEKAVRRMADHPGERAEMGGRARITAVERYDHTVLIERLMAVHRELIGSTRPARR